LIYRIIPEKQGLRELVARPERDGAAIRKTLYLFSPAEGRDTTGM
jgi:hypothetical protein